MILVTGGAGFIGSNIVHALSQRGAAIFVVDNLKRPEKFHNVVDAEVVDYMGKEEFIERLERGEFAGKFSTTKIAAPRWLSA